jgi:hypothetical protein
MLLVCFFAAAAAAAAASSSPAAAAASSSPAAASFADARKAVKYYSAFFCFRLLPLLPRHWNSLCSKCRLSIGCSRNVKSVSFFSPTCGN